MSTSLSNTAVPYYYDRFRKNVLYGKIPVCHHIAQEMNRIDRLIASPMYYYDREAVEKWIGFCESETTLSDGDAVKLLDTFKLWGESIYGWYTFKDKSILTMDKNRQMRYVNKSIKNRLVKKQFLIVPRANAKTMYGSYNQQYFLTMDPATTHQITVAPVMAQAEEIMSPFRTAIARARGPIYKLLTYGSSQNTTGSKNNKPKLMSTKRGIQNFITNSLLEVRPCSIDKLQGLRCKIATFDEWLSVDLREDPIGTIQQGCEKLSDWLIIAMSSEGTVRNGVGDTIKMELLDILKGEYQADFVSIWYYRLDSLAELNMPSMWVKACPNLGITVQPETYKNELERAAHNPMAKNDILAKRFNIPSEGCTYFFTFEETKCHSKHEFWQMPCSLGVDLSMGDDFCSFTFLFPLSNGKFGVKTRAYITSKTLSSVQLALQIEYQKFIKEGSLIIMEGTVLDLEDVYDDLDRHMENCEYEVRCLGYDPYNAKEFINRWTMENGPFGIEKVIQGAKTESVPLGELKKLAEGRQLIFDEQLMHFCMGHCTIIEDNNGNKKLSKRRHDEKIDAVAAMMDAFVAYKHNRDVFD